MPARRAHPSIRPTNRAPADRPKRSPITSRGAAGSAQRRHRMDVEQHRHAEPRARRRQRVGQRGMIGAVVADDPRGDRVGAPAPRPDLGRRPPRGAGSAPARRAPCADCNGAARVDGAVVDARIALVLGAVQVDPRARPPRDQQRLVAHARPAPALSTWRSSSGSSCAAGTRSAREQFGRIVAPGMRHRHHDGARRGGRAVAVEAGGDARSPTLAGAMRASPQCRAACWKILSPFG